jgi:undecaprenyl-diphosphatase
VLDAIVWGLVQGLTEFLPVSSSGHLVLVPAFLSRLGVDIGDPGLAMSAVLHLGTLMAVVVYYRSDLLRVVRSPLDPYSRRLVLLLAIGTVPAVLGLPLRDTLETIEQTPRLVGVALIGTALILLVGNWRGGGAKSLADGRLRDAVVIGLAQALALIPGISRSGSTITAGLLCDFKWEEAARFSFLLAIPAIAGGGLISLLEVSGGDAEAGPIVVGLVVAAVTGYAAITGLIRLLVARGFGPFVWYCLAVGVTALVLL